MLPDKDCLASDDEGRISSGPSPFVFTVFVLGIAVRLALVLDSRHFDTLTDDSYYALSIARNIGQGQGITYSGIMTNGFQPLYVFTSAVFYRLFGRADGVAIATILVLQSLINAATGLLLFGLLRRLKASIGANLALIIWSLSPYVIWNGVNGLETGLATFLLAASAYYYVAKIKHVLSPTLGAYLILGILLGLSVLTRLDMGFWAVAIAFDAVVAPRRSHVFRRITGVLCATAIAALLTAPWFIYSYGKFGSLVPSSGDAVRTISLAIYHAPGQPAEYLSEGCIPTKYYASLLFSSIQTILSCFEPLSTLFSLSGILVLTLVSAAVLWKPLFRCAREHPFLVIFPPFQIGAYSFWIFGPWFFPRYYYSTEAVILIWACLAAQAALNRLAINSKALRSMYITLVLLLLVLPSNSLPQLFLEGRLGSREAVESNTRRLGNIVPDGATIGVFQSGAVEYDLRDRRVLNLDGVVNPYALDALKANRRFEIPTTRAGGLAGGLAVAH